MSKRQLKPPVEPPESILVDSQIVRMVPGKGRTWQASGPLPSFRTVLCRRGRVHLSTGNDIHTVCGDWWSVGDRQAASGWVLAPGTWCRTGVVRCQHCEKSLARLMGEPAARRTT